MGRLAAEPVSVHRKTAGFRSNLAAVAGPGALSEFDQGKHRALLLPSQELRETALTTVYAKVWCGIAERAGTHAPHFTELQRLMEPSEMPDIFNRNLHP